MLSSCCGLDEFVEGLCKRMSDIESSLLTAEDQVFGPASSRLSRVSTAEMYEKCLSLYMTNQSLLEQADASNAENKPTSNVVGARSETSKRPNLPKKAVVDSSSAVSVSNAPIQSIPVKSVINAVSGSQAEAGINTRPEEIEILLDDDKPTEEACAVEDAADDTSVPEEPVVDDANPRTPSLAVWKLSSATKHLVNAAASTKPTILFDSPQPNETVSQPSVQPIMNDLSPASPVISQVKPKEISLNPTSQEAEKSIYQTPKQHYQSYKPADMDLTPKTPTLGTPFHSHAIRELIANGTEVATIPVQGNSRAVQFKEIQPESLDDSALDISTEMSPCRAVEDIIISEEPAQKESLRIETLSPDEWGNAPSFLRVQASMHINSSNKSNHQYLK
jgi:hypothetical protein